MMWREVPKRTSQTSLTPTFIVIFYVFTSFPSPATIVSVLPFRTKHVGELSTLSVCYFSPPPPNFYLIFIHIKRPYPVPWC